MKYDLPSVRENINDISEAIFAILHKYAAAGLSKGENFDLVVSAFKASIASISNRVIAHIRKYTLFLTSCGSVSQKAFSLLIFNVQVY